MSGLQRHPSLDDRFDPAIRIVAYDPRWREQAEQELERIRRALGPRAIRLDHIGSTAVPGLAAKPILDLQLTIADIDETVDIAEPLEALGYRFAQDPESPDHHFFAKPAKRPRTHHLHVCQADSDHERRHLAVRDFLREHPEEAKAYEALKRELATRHPQDRLAYIDGKDAHVQALQQRAETWAAHRRSGRATKDPDRDRQRR